MKDVMFEVGDIAKVLVPIRRRDGRSQLDPDDIVTITHVYNCQDGETQVVGISSRVARPMNDIVLLKGSRVFEKIY